MHRQADSNKTIRGRLRSGAMSGLWYGGVFAGLTGLAMLIAADRLEERLHAPPGQVALFYLIAGVGLGIAGALLKPFVRSRPGYWFFGFVLALPVTAMAIALFKGLAYLRGPAGLPLTLAIALLLGPMSADTFRDR